ncbi:thrombospondin type-1 domain-containing protein 7B-like [Ruditapes philippinarum]|uniref:thrombospondin type-1 domain-containing protein 7B-like n=1 Tax=Ruditapes philippinarum TaxID=129788 RepID=UPI00295A5A9C|nr:thrombospondin type-1 domain-containing protein 7B-like [Ruditapes philippinarum]
MCTAVNMKAMKMQSRQETRMKRRNVSAIGCSLLVVLSAISHAASLECYSCSDAVNLDACTAAETCRDGQVCFKKREFTNQVQFDMGCIDKKDCGQFAQTRNASEILKMSADKRSYCYECCSKDRCNKDICEYPSHSLCKDDESVDCARLNSMFSICKIAREAKKMCPKYCELCDLVDGSWSLWSQWSSCDVTCGIGSILRRRSCTNPSPKNGGLDCPGNGTEMKACKLKLCPVHGGWTSWETWGKCSVSCGVGMRNRRRLCTNPRPERFGNHCFGDSTEYELCYNRLCAGVWTDWQTWSNCFVKSHRSVQTRNRTCSKNVFTEDCEGNSTEIRACEGATLYTDCSDIKQLLGKQNNGIYNVTLWKTNLTLPVVCDFSTDGGGWTVFQYRFDGSVDFYRNLLDYTNGFGSLNGEFWLGLKYIYEMLTQGKSELRLDLTAADGTVFQEVFQNFQLDNSPYYTLHINGTGGLGLSTDNGRHFSTYDADRDTSVLNCAVSRHGGWWYGSCTSGNLNGEYITPGTKSSVNVHRSMYYYPFKETYSLRISRMMFRRVLKD